MTVARVFLRLVLRREMVFWKTLRSKDGVGECQKSKTAGGGSLQRSGPEHVPFGLAGLFSAFCAGSLQGRP